MKLRNMTGIYLSCNGKMLLLYRQGGRVVSNQWIASAGGHFEKEELNDPNACVLRELREELHLNSGTQLQTMDRSTRDQYLHVLLEHGLSIRQIERLTGINRGIISRL